MICGKCKTQGVTVTHVRECYWPTVTPTLADLVRQGEDVEGVYYKAEANTYYKVVSGTNTGNWYAKEAVFFGSHGQVEWEYRGRKPLHFLTALDRVTAEQAAQFGQVTGACVFCSRKLTDERSIAVGYGPICAEREGLPWGEVA